jgi:hypothetical protein
VDLATKRHPSYCVEIIGQGYRAQPIVVTLYMVTFSSELQNWWHTKRRYLEKAATAETPLESVALEQVAP